MSCEDGGEIELPHARHDESDAAHPLVEVGDDPGRRVGVVFRGVAEGSEELGDHEPEGAHVVRLHVLLRDPDPGLLEQFLRRIMQLISMKSKSKCMLIKVGRTDNRFGDYKGVPQYENILHTHNSPDLSPTYPSLVLACLNSLILCEAEPTSKRMICGLPSTSHRPQWILYPRCRSCSTA